MKKKLLASLLASAMMVSMVACSTDAGTETTDTVTEESAVESTEASDTVMITVIDGKENEIEVEFPVNPERVVALNWQTVDFLDAVGMGDSIVGLIKSGSYPEHLEEYYLDEDIVNVGGMKDPDFEAIMSLEPDAIFSSDRTVSMYEEFAMIAPTMAAYVEYEDGFMNSYKELAENHGKIFGITEEVNEIIAGYEERIQAIADFAEGKTALLGIFAGGLNTLGDVGRCSIVVNEMGFENLAGGEDVNHGNISSYELFLELDPEYMFILDKDTAVGTEAVAAKEQMEVDNPIIAETSAFQNGNIIYLEPGAAWYIADGGITSLDLMINSVEVGLGLK